MPNNDYLTLQEDNNGDNIEMKEKSSFTDEKNCIGNPGNNYDEVIVNSSLTTISISRPPPVFVYVYNPWFLVLRIMHGILALITISEGIMAALLNHYSGYPVIGLCSSFSILSFLISLFFTSSNFVDYRAFRIASLASICTSIITLICAIVTFNALGTLTACVSGTNRSYAPISTFDYWIQSTTNEQYNIYYDRLVKCANRDPYAFRDCNCINTKTDNVCFKNIQAYDVCQDMLNYSPSLSRDVYYFSIVHFIMSCLLAIMFFVTIKDLSQRNRRLSSQEDSDDGVVVGSIVLQTSFVVDSTSRRANASRYTGGGNIDLSGFNFSPVGNPMHHHSHNGDIGGGGGGFSGHHHVDSNVFVACFHVIGHVVIYCFVVISHSFMFAFECLCGALR